MSHPQQTDSRPAEVITQQSRTNFFYSFLVLPKPQREAIETVYAFCRVVDDIVDEDLKTDDPQLELNRWRNEIASCFNGHAPSTRLGNDVKKTVGQFPIPKHYFEELIVGMEMDLERRRYASFTELERYCYHVAGVTGLMCIEIFGYHHPSAMDFAVKLGTALQIVNIMRDLKEDAKRGRVYLPQDEMQRFCYSEEQLMNGVYNDNFVALMQHQGRRARSFFDQAQAALNPEDRPRMVSAHIMGKIYFKILERIEAANYNVFGERLALSKTEKAMVAISTWMRAKF